MREAINICFLLFFVTVFGVAQTTIQPKGQQYEYKGVVYNNERAYNFTLHTHGFYVGMDIGKINTYYKTRYYHFSLGYIKHRTEERQNKNINIQGFGTSRSFVFGKRNYLYPIRAGVGVKRYLSEKAKRRGIAVGWNYEIGPVIGIMRAYQLIFARNDGSGIPKPEVVSYDSNPDVFLDYNKIYGGTSTFSGWNQIKIRPGIQCKVGAHFSKGAFEKFVRAMEFGIMADYYFTKVPLIVENESQKNQAIFFNLYVTLQIGNRK